MSKLPECWETTKIGEVCKFSQGVQIPVEEQLTEAKENYVRFLRISDYTQNTSDIRYVPNSYINNTISEEEVVMVRYGETAGHIGKGFCGVLANNLFTMIPTTEKLSKEFLYIFMKQPSMYRYLKKLRAAGAMPAVNFKSLSIIKLPIPPLEEQKKIADILSTVDQKIAFIEENISQTQELKKGLMQKLLTQGIGHTEFKDSEIGRIPESWEVKKLEESCERIVGGGTPSKNESSYWNGGTILWVTPSEFTKNDSNYISISENKITEEGLKNSSATLLNPQTVIMSSRATIGECKINTTEMTTNQGFISFQCNEILNNAYLLYLIKQNKKKIIKVSSGSTFLEVSRTTMKNFKLPIPPLEEQKQIAEILSTVDQKLEVLKDKKGFFQELKKGLMQKLLTGEVRV